MNDEPNKPIEAEELTDKELEGIVGGTVPSQDSLIVQAALKVSIRGS